MSSVQQQDKVEAIICSDLHFSHQAPVAREEKGAEWYGVMENYLDQLRTISMYVNGTDVPNVPIVVCGDIFHKWNSPPELINFLLQNMPKVHAIPGQHDLPYHNYADLGKSAYWTLCRAGIINNLDFTNSPLKLGTTWIMPSLWGKPILNQEKSISDNKIVGIIHQYVWRRGSMFPRAPEKEHVDEVRKKLVGYHSAFFGDNHKGFMDVEEGKIPIINCGGFIRRNSDEIEYKPAVYLLYRSGKIVRRELDTSKDRITKTAADNANVTLEVRDFIELLQDMDAQSLSFKESLSELMKTRKMSPDCYKVLFSIMDSL